MREETRRQFEDTDEGWQKRWNKEMATSKKMLDKFCTQGEKVVARYLDDRKGEQNSQARLNLFHSGISTMKALLFGQIPKVTFDRRNVDSDDDVARVASVIFERLLNADIERPNDDYSAVMRSCLEDRLLPGLAVARIRYDASFTPVQHDAVLDPTTGAELAPAYTDNRMDFERVCTDYVHWKDFRWSHSRVWHEVRWVAFRNWLSLDELTARFGEEKAEKVTLKHQYADEKSKDVEDAWQKGEVWEIWNKENRKVYWWSEGMDVILDRKDDIYELSDFFPCPRPMIANSTTTLLLPRSDFYLSQDIYNAIDLLNTRIEVLTKSLRVVGVYDKNSEEVARILKEAGENEMIAVERWAMFSEKQGLKGVVDWFPLETVVNTLDKLRELLGERIAFLYQVTGLSDIMRGQSEGSDRVSATEQSIKAKYASVRMQALQDEFARFGTDLMRLKGELTAHLCSPETMIGASNILMTPDAALASPAVQLLKDSKQYVWRVAVRPESLSMVDYQTLQSERQEYLMALSQFIQSMMPAVESLPGSMPVLLDLLKWGLAGFKGSQEIEGVLDRAIEQLKKNPLPEKPDPAAEKAKADAQAKQMEVEGKQQLIQAELQAKQQEAQLELQKAQMEFMAEQQKLQLEAAAAQQKMRDDQERFLMEMRQDMQKFAMEMSQARAKGQQDLALAEQKAEQKAEATADDPA